MRRRHYRHPHSLIRVLIIDALAWVMDKYDQAHDKATSRKGTHP